MSESSEPALLRRLCDFELELHRRSSELVERHDWGELIVNPSTDELWGRNFLSVEDSDLGADALASLAGELLAAQGISHRFVVPADPAHGAQLEAGFSDLGWEVQRSVYMVRRRPSERQTEQAVEVPPQTIASVRRAVGEADPDFTREAIEQRFIRDRRLAQVGNGRCFAAPAEGEPDAACVLYELDGVGQVETVETAPAMRGRGLASAVVLAAVDASRRAGHELTFIVADAEDWPWQLYARLGFDRIGEACWFLRKAQSP